MAETELRQPLHEGFHPVTQGKRTTKPRTEIRTLSSAKGSFAYYGIARVESVDLSWPEALVTSLFVPFTIGDLLRNLESGEKLLNFY